MRPARQGRAIFRPCRHKEVRFDSSASRESMSLFTGRGSWSQSTKCRFGARCFRSPVWAALLYLGLFVLVTMHEFGHALACRQVGGRANRIVLWPLGGIAFVNPPRRAGAMLWSIAAGPLVNVLLFPILTFVLHTAANAGLIELESGCLSRFALDLADQSLSASLQSAADLSTRRRPDFALNPLVSVRPNSKPLHRDRSWFSRRRRAGLVRVL